MRGIFVEDESKLASALSPHVTDVAMSPPSPQVGFVHRHTESAEIYFIANTSNRPVDLTATFRVEGMQPQIWNPVTGKAAAAQIIARPFGGTSIRLTLEAYESSVVVWAENSDSRATSGADHCLDSGPDGTHGSEHRLECSVR